MSNIYQKPLIVSYFDGDSEVRDLSNFAITPYTLDGISYKCVEGFWQSLKTEVPVIRAKFSFLEGLDAKQMGRMINRLDKSGLFTYQGKLYCVGSEAHHVLLERAIRAKTAQNAGVRKCFELSGNRPLKHLFRNAHGSWRSGDSPAIPAIVFERMLMTIRTELQEARFIEHLSLPPGVNDLLNFTP